MGRHTVLLVLLLSALPAWAVEPLHLAVFAFRPKPILEARYQPLADYLSGQLGGPRVELRVLDQSEIEAGLASGEVDFVLTNPSHYIFLRSKYTLTGALATLISLENGQPSSFLGGVIITRARHQDIRTLADLPGRRIAAPGSRFLGGYQAQVHELKRLGIHLPQAAPVTMVGNHDRVVREVLAGRADVGFIRTGVLESMAREGRIDLADIQVINPQKFEGFPFLVSTRLYPEWAFLALPHVDPRITRRVVSALLALDSKHPAARAAEIDGFSPPADYLPAEELARSLRLPPFDGVPAFTWHDLWRQYSSWIVALGTSLLLLTGAMAGLVVSYRNLDRNKAWLRALINTLPDLVWLKDANGAYLFCNPRFEQFFGVPGQRIVGKTDYDFLAPEQADAFRASDQAAMNRGGPVINEETVTFARDGHQERLETTRTPMLDATGRLIGILGVGHDITKRKSAEEALAESEARFRQFFERNSSVMLLIEPATGQIVDANRAASRYYGYSPDELVGMDICHINTLSPHELAMERELARRQARSHFIFVHRLASGDLRDVEVYSTPVNVSGRQLLFSIIHDITERKQAENSLQLAASVFTHAREGIMITDAEGRIVEVNDAFTRITGYLRQDVLGENPRILKSGRQSPEYYANMWRALKDDGYWSGEIWNRRKDGQVFAEMTTISAVRDSNGAVRNYVALFTDITPLKEHQKQLEHIAHYDPLTHLPNRVLLADRLRQAMSHSQRRDEQLAVVYLDLDGFKAVNDTHGHGVGDELLIAIAQRMKTALREGDTLARIGGDEFVAVLVGLDGPQDCEPILSRLLQAASGPTEIGDLFLSVSASIGVTLYPQDTGDAEQLMRHADQAMYVAKQAGKN